MQDPALRASGRAVGATIGPPWSNTGSPSRCFAPARDDAWWHRTRNVLVSSEWGSPSMIEDGLVPALLLGGRYGHAIRFWDLAEGRHVQRIDLGAQHQMTLEVRPVTSGGPNRASLPEIGQDIGHRTAKTALSPR